MLRLKVNRIWHVAFDAVIKLQYDALSTNSNGQLGVIVIATNLGNAKRHYPRSLMLSEAAELLSGPRGAPA